MPIHVLFLRFHFISLVCLPVPLEYGMLTFREDDRGGCPTPSERNIF